MEGVVLRRQNGFRVVITLEHIARSIAVEVPLEELEPVPDVEWQRDGTYGD
jgi:hypothetical protein